MATENQSPRPFVRPGAFFVYRGRRMRYRLLLGSKRYTDARGTARWAYLRTRRDGGSLEDAISLAKTNLKSKRYGFWETIAISIAIKLVIALIKWWWDKRVSDPGGSPMKGEPGA